MFKPSNITIAAVMVTLNAALATFGALANYATVEEGRQIPAGLSFWRGDRLRLAADTPPLPRMLATMPVAITRPKSDLTFSPESYQRYHLGIDAEIRQKFYEKNIGSYELIIFMARMVNLFWWAIGAWLVLEWSRNTWGAGAGWLGLSLWCFAPNVLAFEMLASPELAAGVTFSATCYSFWRWQESATCVRATAAGCLLGVALLTDFAAMSLYIILPVAWVASRPPVGESTRRVAQLVLIGWLGLAILNLGYGLGGTASPLRDFAFASDLGGGTPARRSSPHEYARVGNRFASSWLGEIPIPLPADFVYGLDLRRQSAEQSWRQSDDRSWPGGSGQDPLMVAAARIPLGLWALLACATLGVMVSAERHERPGAATYLLLVLSGCTLAIASRFFFLSEKAYFLVFPMSLVLVDGLPRRLGRLRSLAWCLAAWVVVGGLATYPRCLNYLNEAVGGSHSVSAQARYASRADSGLDAVLLREWLESHRADWPVGVACDTVVDFRSFAIKTARPPIDPGPELSKIPGYTRAVGPKPGVYAIDALNLSRPRWRYFLDFEPTARLGLTTYIYRIERDAAESVRRRLGSPPLPEEGLASTPGDERGFVHKIYHDANGQDYNYAVFVPKDYSGDRPYPLIMMLHGYGDRGFDGRRFLKVGLPRAVEARKDTFNFFVICPEGHEGNWATDGDDARIVMQILEKTLEEYRIDRKRLYLTGVSSGALATWRFASRYPNRWAAIFPVATSECDPSQAAALRRMPVWCFHNFNDVMSPPEIPRRMIDAVEAAGGNPRYSEFVVLTDEEERTDPLIRKHNAWTKAYANEDLYDWLLENRLP